MERCATSLAVREMPIKTTLRYRRTPVITAKIKMTRNKKHWEGCREKGTLVYRWWECTSVQSLGKQHGTFSKNRNGIVFTRAAVPPLAHWALAEKRVSQVWVPRLLESGLPALSHQVSDWLQKPLARVRPLLERWRNLILLGQGLWWHYNIRSPLNFWFTLFLSRVWLEKLLRTSKQTCPSRVQLLVLCKWGFCSHWWASLKTPTCVLSMPNV